MTALPTTGLLVPIEWQGETAKTTMQAGRYTLSGTLGWEPNKESATLSWRVTPAQAKTMLDTFKATNFNGVFTYTCQVRGAIKLRLNGTYSVEEVTTAGSWIKKVIVTAGVETV